jgi:hypothetical protein
MPKQTTQPRLIAALFRIGGIKFFLSVVDRKGMCANNNPDGPGKKVEVAHETIDHPRFGAMNFEVSPGIYLERAQPQTFDEELT